LEKDLFHYPAIRGQMISRISWDLKVVDQNRKSIIYHDEVREILFALLASATFNLTIPVTDFGVSNETNRYYR
jgi:hypothetical protein